MVDRQKMRDLLDKIEWEGGLSAYFRYGGVAGFDAFGPALQQAADEAYLAMAELQNRLDSLAEAYDLYAEDLD